VTHDAERAHVRRRADIHRAAGSCRVANNATLRVFRRGIVEEFDEYDRRERELEEQRCD